MIKAHKIRINPTPEQEAQLWQATHNARFTFNWGLARWNEIYEAGGKPTINFIKKELTDLKRAFAQATYKGGWLEKKLDGLKTITN